MLDEVDLKTIVQQYIVQMAAFFLANIQEKMSNARSHSDDMDIMGTMADFRSGFDRRLQLITTNHVLLNLDKEMLDGTLFNRMLNVNNPGEWLRLIEQIKRDHFRIKNRINYEEIRDRIIHYCEVS